MDYATWIVTIGSKIALCIN